jgi:hypothetical protein
LTPDHLEWPGGAGGLHARGALMALRRAHNALQKKNPEKRTVAD